MRRLPDDRESIAELLMRRTDVDGFVIVAHVDKFEHFGLGGPALAAFTAQLHGTTDLDRATKALTRAGLNQTQHARQTVAALANKAASNGGYHRAGLTSTVKLG